VHEFTYPLLHGIAMDVLPIQASSVLSERVFSSSKMTCTTERNRLSVRTMEALQVLKHVLKHHRRESSEVALDLVSHVFETLELED
ncbi:hAT family dimerization protein, partial [Rhizoctonia solani 123E]